MQEYILLLFKDNLFLKFRISEYFSVFREVIKTIFSLSDIEIKSLVKKLSLLIFKSFLFLRNSSIKFLKISILSDIKLPTQTNLILSFE